MKRLANFTLDRTDDLSRFLRLAESEEILITRHGIVRIGNSRSIRVPKILLDQAQLPDEVELHAEPGRLVVQGARRPRMGWAEAARTMSKQGQDDLLDEPTATRFDQEEWEW